MENVKSEIPNFVPLDTILQEFKNSRHLHESFNTLLESNLKYAASSAIAIPSYDFSSNKQKNKYFRNGIGFCSSPGPIHLLMKPNLELNADVKVYGCGGADILVIYCSGSELFCVVYGINLGGASIEFNLFRPYMPWSSPIKRESYPLSCLPDHSIISGLGVAKLTAPPHPSRMVIL